MGYVRYSSFVNLLQERAISHPNHVVFTFLGDGETESNSLTYQQLDQQAKAIASYLQEHNAIGARALLLYQPGLEFVSAFLGCLYAGVIATPAYPPRANRSYTRLATIINDAQAHFALTTEAVKNKIEQKLTKNNAIIVIPTDIIPISLAKSWQPLQITADDTAFLQYTSGSTGAPKGVIVSHGNLIHNSQLIKDFFEHEANCRVATWLPPYHDMGLIGGILQPIYSRLNAIMLPPVTFLQRPIRWLRAISKYKINTSGGPNFAYEMCVNSVTAKQKKDLDLSSWNVAFSGAEPVRAETLAKFSDYFADCGFNPQAFYPCYGMAETTLIVSGSNKHQSPTVKKISASALQDNRISFNPDDEDSQQVVSSGKVATDFDCLIVNPNTLLEGAENTVGEIWLKGKSVTQGYWHKPELTQNIFFAKTEDGENQGYLRTGDLGFISNGELFVTGRLKDLIIIRGRNHYPQDIEETVGNCHEAINSESGASFAIEKNEQEELVVVFEVKRTFLQRINQDEKLTNEIFNSIRQAIAENHELQIYSIVLIRPGSLPKTSSGKIARYACRQEFLADNLAVVNQWNLTSGLSRKNNFQQDNLQFSKHLNQENKQFKNIVNWLKDNLAKRLNINPQQINIRQPFVNYGLDSVQAVQLTADLEDYLEVKLAPTLAYDYPDIESLTNYLIGNKSEVILTEEKKETSALHRQQMAIVGVACRFPNANNHDEYWDLLSKQKLAVKKTYLHPASESWGGYIEDYDKFDAQFFGISPREAENIDPQQRLLLEVAYEALEDANISLEKIAGSKTGVFIGISSQDYAQLQMKHGWEVNVYSGTSNSSAIASNRISYSFNLTGPSLSVDTACSSSLVAIHLAVNSLRNSECDTAIVGGVNLILLPELTETFQKAGMMAEDGRCKTFSEDADGYVRGEGCGVVILKPVEKAIEDGDNIWGVIYGSAINQDGRSNGLTAPSGKAQQQVIQSAWQNASITPDKINYIETHGTGTPLGDPIEVNSLSALFPVIPADDVLMHSQNSHRNTEKNQGNVLDSDKQGNVVGDDKQEDKLTEKENICWIGSAKTNIGHLEAAAGIAGLIKTLLMLRHNTIPPIINFSRLNPYINLTDSRLKIATEMVKWHSNSPRFAGVSSFGFGGTNAHVIVGDMILSGNRQEAKGNDLDKRQDVNFSSQEVTGENEENNPPDSLLERGEVRENIHKSYLLTLSATTPLALKDLVTKYLDYLETKTDDDIGNICYTTQQGRTPFPQRASVVANSIADLRENLSNLSIPENSQTISNKEIVFLFTGQGSQYHGMGAGLYQTCASFRDTVNYCSEVLKQYLDIPLTEVIFQEDKKDLLNQTIYTQSAIFVIEYALAKLWLSWGIKPSLMIGHSIGEYVAATLAGVFSLEDALKLVAHRGKLMQQLPLNGGMVCLFTNILQVNELIKHTNLALEVSAINSDNNIVVSGLLEDLEILESKASLASIKYRRLKVSHGFHSSLMQPILEDFRKIASEITYYPADNHIISNVTATVEGALLTTPDYWVQHIIKPVRFAESIEILKQQGYQIFLEIGAKPTLLAMTRLIIENQANDYLWLPSLRKNESDWQMLLTSLGSLYQQGISINWHGFHQDDVNLTKVSLPNYAWQHQSYWHGENYRGLLNNPSDNWLYEITWEKDTNFAITIDN
ncbi:MAG: AMP-binding protein [Cyanobacterium sp. T60_A2020_053]|nr:AMP-binding protein [Cyanobacterium sp. T60_A2020_053]